MYLFLKNDDRLQFYRYYVAVNVKIRRKRIYMLLILLYIEYVFNR
jgi:hypothetical protein